MLHRNASGVIISTEERRTGMKDKTLPPVRVTEEERETVIRAAEILKRTPSDFIRLTVLEKAENILSSSKSK